MSRCAMETSGEANTIVTIVTVPTRTQAWRTCNMLRQGAQQVLLRHAQGCIWPSGVKSFFYVRVSFVSKTKNTTSSNNSFGCHVVDVWLFAARCTLRPAPDRHALPGDLEKLLFHVRRSMKSAMSATLNSLLRYTPVPQQSRS